MGELQSLAHSQVSHCSPTQHVSVALSWLLIGRTFFAAPYRRVAYLCFVMSVIFSLFVYNILFLVVFIIIIVYFVNDGSWNCGLAGY